MGADTWGVAALNPRLIAVIPPGLKHTKGIPARINATRGIPVGMRAISLGLSAATPQVADSLPNPRTPVGVPATPQVLLTLTKFSVAMILRRPHMASDP